MDVDGDPLKSVYSTQDPLLIGHLRNLLVSEGIECDIKTPFLGAAKGDIPFTECWSQLVITNDDDFDAASRVIKAAFGQGTEPGASWRCPRCGEEVEEQFGACWQCGSARSEGNA